MNGRVVPPASMLGSVLLAIALVLATPAWAGVSGTLSPVYGQSLTVQPSQSNVGGSDSPYALINENDQSQLDAAYGYVSNGTLYLFFSGSLIFWVQLEGGIEHWQPLDV